MYIKQIAVFEILLLKRN